VPARFFIGGRVDPIEQVYDCDWSATIAAPFNAARPGLAASGARLKAARAHARGAGILQHDTGAEALREEKLGPRDAGILQHDTGAEALRQEKRGPRPAGILQHDTGAEALLQEKLGLSNCTGHPHLRASKVLFAEVLTGPITEASEQFSNGSGNTAREVLFTEALGRGSGSKVGHNEGIGVLEQFTGGGGTEAADEVLLAEAPGSEGKDEARAGRSSGSKMGNDEVHDIEVLAEFKGGSGGSGGKDDARSGKADAAEAGDVRLVWADEVSEDEGSRGFLGAGRSSVKLNRRQRQRLA
jgi:hypothetical protein